MDTHIVSKKIIPLLQQLLDKRINIPQFETEYMSLWRRVRDENIILPERDISLLNKLFVVCDAYCADPSLSSDTDLDDMGLYKEAKEVLDALGV